MHKIDLNEKIYNLEGKQAYHTIIREVEEEREKDGKKEKVMVQKRDNEDMVLGHLLRGSLLQSEKDEDPERVHKQYLLLRKCTDHDTIEITDEEKELLKSCLSRSYDVIFAGQAINLL